MKPHQKEALLVLFSRPEWAMFIEYKKERLAKLHEALEHKTGDDFRMVQGEIAEIRLDLSLQQATSNWIEQNK